jgi:hypothetical protein
LPARAEADADDANALMAWRAPGNKFFDNATQLQYDVGLRD